MWVTATRQLTFDDQYDEASFECEADRYYLENLDQPSAIRSGEEEITTQPKHDACVSRWSQPTLPLKPRTATIDGRTPTSQKSLFAAQAIPHPLEMGPARPAHWCLSSGVCPLVLIGIVLCIGFVLQLWFLHGVLFSTRVFEVRHIDDLLQDRPTDSRGNSAPDMQVCLPYISPFTTADDRKCMRYFLVYKLSVADLDDRLETSAEFALYVAACVQLVVVLCVYEKRRFPKPYADSPLELATPEHTDGLCGDGGPFFDYSTPVPEPGVQERPVIGHRIWIGSNTVVGSGGTGYALPLRTRIGPAALWIKRYYFAVTIFLIWICVGPSLFRYLWTPNATGTSGFWCVVGGSACGWSLFLWYRAKCVLSGPVSEISAYLGGDESWLEHGQPNPLIVAIRFRENLLLSPKPTVRLSLVCNRVYCPKGTSIGGQRCAS